VNFVALLLSFLLFSAQARVGTHPSLEDICNREADYCRKLELAALDFVCLEDITEKVDQSKDIKFDTRSSFDGATDGYWVRPESVVPPIKIKRTLLYDFQFIRKGGRIKETRTLIAENGKKKKEENAKLKTLNFIYQNALLAPVAIFGSNWRDVDEYRISGEARVEDRLCLIIEVNPKLTRPDIRFLFGRAFVDKDTLEILKIEWNEQKIGNFAMFERRGKRYGLKPHITVASEFAVEKNGIRFPSRHSIEEAYLDPKGKKFIRSQTSVVYRDFKFFTVSVEEIKVK
jgi:hypothetical protein